MGFYEVTGRDKRNWVKLKCLYCLKRYSQSIPYSTHRFGFTVGELAHLTNNNQRSLYTLLKRWWRWGLVEWLRFQTEAGIESYFCSTARGEAYLKGAYGWYKLIHQVEAEVDTCIKRARAIRASDWATVKAIDSGSG